VAMEDTGASYYAILQPTADLSRLVQVFVISSSAPTMEAETDQD